jgi:group I intron endonuclease
MKAGIYKITNIANGKVYVGSSSNIAGRWRQHASTLRLGKHANPKLQHAWNKYGSDAFTFDVIETVDTADLLIREAHHIRELDAVLSGYNISNSPGRERAGMSHTPEAIEKMSLAAKGRTISAEHRKSLSDAFKGRTFSDETRLKITLAKIGKKRAPFSDETRANMAAGQLGRTQTAETRAKLSAHRKGAAMSVEARANMSAAQRGRVMPPEVIAKREATKRAKRLQVQEGAE